MEAITSSPCYRAVIPRNSEVGTQSGPGQEIEGVEQGGGLIWKEAEWDEEAIERLD